MSQKGIAQADAAGQKQGMKTLLGWVLLCVLVGTAAGAEITVAGEAFISSGTSKFRAAKIVAYPMEAALRALETNMSNPEMPTPLAKTESDSEGRWSMKVPEQTPFLLVAHGSHYAPRVNRTTRFEWRIKSTDIEDFGNVMLTEKNAQPNTNITVGR